jgi:hypothetical protein
MPINPPYKYYVENLKGKNVKEWFKYILFYILFLRKNNQCKLF